MRKLIGQLLVFSLGLFGICLVALVIFVKVYLTPVAKDLIEKKGSEALGGSLQMNSLSLSVIPPIFCKMQAVRVEIPSSGVLATSQVVHAQTDIGIIDLIRQFKGESSSPGHIEIYFESPDLTLDTTLSEAPEKAAGTSGALGGKAEGHGETPSQQAMASPAEILAKLPYDFGLKVKIDKGRINIKQSERTTELHHLSFGLETKSLKEGPYQINLATTHRMVTRAFTLDIPLRFATQISMRDSEISWSELRGDLANMAFNSQGSYDLARGASQWQIGLNVPELADMPVPPSMLPPGQWRGKVSVELKGLRAPMPQLPLAQGWQFDGHLKLDHLSGLTEWKKDDLSAKGKLTAAANIQFSVTPDPSGNSQIKAQHANLDIDLTQLSINKNGLFQKPAAVPLTLKTDFTASKQSAVLKNLDLRFANLNLLASGDVGLIDSAPSHLRIKVDRTSLDGWEAYFPLLASSPVNGAAELTADVQGPLTKPELLSVSIEPLRLDKLEGHVKWRSADGSKEVHGPIRADGSVDLLAHHSDLKKAKVFMSLDLTGTSLKVKNQFQKQAGQALTLNLQGSQQGSALEIKKAHLNILSNSLQLTGSLANLAKPMVNLKAIVPKLSLDEMGNLFPAVKNFALKGQASGSAHLSGTYDPQKGFEKSPLQMTAKLSVHLPHFKIEKDDKKTKAPQASSSTAVTATESGSQKKSKSAPTAPSPLLPPWPVVQNAIIDSNLRLDSLNYDSLVIKGLQSRFSLRKGQLIADMQIENVFGGRLAFEKLKANLRVAQPNISTTTTFSGINLQEAAGFFSSDWRDLVRGQMTGQASVEFPHPSHPKLLEQIKASSRIQIQNGFFSTAQLDQLVNTKIMQIPGISSKAQVDSKGVAADVTSRFRVLNKSFQIDEFLFLSPEKNELRLKGTLGFDKIVNMEGVAYLATAPVGGSVRAANSDDQGRFVIPVRLKGDLSQPELSFAQESVTQVLKRTAEYELNKSKKKVEDRLVDELKDRLRKEGLKGLLGDE